MKSSLRERGWQVNHSVVKSPDINKRCWNSSYFRYYPS